jgi:hypothetical protein
MFPSRHRQSLHYVGNPRICLLMQRREKDYADLVVAAYNTARQISYSGSPCNQDGLARQVIGRTACNE